MNKVVWSSFLPTNQNQFHTTRSWCFNHHAQVSRRIGWVPMSENQSHKYQMEVRVAIIYLTKRNNKKIWRIIYGGLPWVLTITTTLFMYTVITLKCRQGHTVHSGGLPYHLELSADFPCQLLCNATEPIWDILHNTVGETSVTDEI